MKKYLKIYLVKAYNKYIKIIFLNNFFKRIY